MRWELQIQMHPSASIIDLKNDSSTHGGERAQVDNREKNAEFHNGEVLIESESGRGSCVKIKLPIEF